MVQSINMLKQEVACASLRRDAKLVVVGLADGSTSVYELEERAMLRILKS